MADLAKIQFKRSATSGSTPTGLSAGELAMNTKDGRLFSSDGTNIIEFGLSKGGTIDGNLTINGNIITSGGGELAAADGNLYLNKSGATGWIDSLFLRKDISNTMNGTFTATGQIAANSGMITSNDANHYIRLGVSGTNNYSLGNYGGTFNFINTSGNSNVLSLAPGSASFTNGTASVSLGKILFNPNSSAGTGTNSNNDYSRGVGFNIESVDTSNSNYPSSMGTLMTSVLSSLRVFQLFSTSGSGQNLYFRDMRNDGSGNVAWNQLYSTAFKPGASDVGAYSTSQSDSLFAPKSNFYLNGTDAHVQGTGSSYLFMNANGAAGVYNGSTRAATWAFDVNGNLINGNIPISGGGTGATTVAGALANLGLGNAVNPNFSFPGNYTGKAAWIKLANVISSGSGVGKLNLAIYGSGNYGSGLSEINYVDISARMNTSTATDNNLLAHRRAAISTTDTSFGYVANFSGSTITSYDIYMKDNSGWSAGVGLDILANNASNYITGPAVDGNFGSWLSSEPANISYTEVRSLASNWLSDTVQIAGEFVSTNSNGVRISPDASTSSTSTVLRTDGNSFYVLLSNNGKNTGNNWNSLRPFAVNTSSGLVTIGNGANISGGTTINDSMTVSNGVINTNDSGHYIDLGKNGNNAAKWVVYGGQFSFINSNGNNTVTQLNNGAITTSGNISTITDNSGIIAGNNGDLGLIKKSGSGAKVVIGSGNPFIIAKSNNSSISPSDTLTNIFSIDTGGNTHVMGTLQTDGAATLSGAIINNGLTVNGGSTTTGTITANSGINASGNITTKGYLFASGGMSSGFIPPTQGSYIGWNLPSGRGQTAFMNHKGGGSGGFTFHNSDGNSQTVIVDISGGGDMNLTSGSLTVSNGNMYIPNGVIYGKDSGHYIDMTTDSYKFSTYNGQYYFNNSNGNSSAQLSYSGNIKGSQWGNAWLSDYMNSTYATLSGNNTLTGNLTVNGTISSGSSISSKGLSSSNGLTVSSGSTTISGGLTSSGYTTLTGATVNNGLTVNGSATINNGLTVNSNVTVGGATYQTDGNVKGSVWNNGYLTDFINAFNDKNGAVGSYVYASTGAHTNIDYGATIAGSSLHPCSVAATSTSSSTGSWLDNVAAIHFKGDALPGTWRCQGWCPGTYTEASLFQRIA